MLQMMEIEKANLLGLSPSQTVGEDSKSQTPFERMQQFLQITHENCFHILGSAGPALGRDFFQIPQLAPALVSHVFTNLDVSFVSSPDVWFDMKSSKSRISRYF